MSLETRLTAVLQTIGADIKALMTGGGSAVQHFFVEDDGVAGQLTTGSFVTLAGVWSAPSRQDSAFSFDSVTGILTMNAGGYLSLTSNTHSWNDLNNRHELHTRLRRAVGAGAFVTMKESSSYTSRNNTQDEGQTVIPSFKFSVAAGDRIDLQIRDVGVAATVGAPNVAGQTYLSAELYQ